MKTNGYLNLSELICEIEIDGKFVSLYRYSKRKYFLCIEGQENALEFSSRKAVDEFIIKM